MTIENSLLLISNAKSSKNYILNTTFNEDNFRGHYLNYFVFSNVKFYRCDFREIDARLAIFDECLFVECLFENANFQYTEFTKCEFVSHMDIVNIENISLGGARIVQCTIYRDCLINFMNSSLRNANISECAFGRVNAKDSSLEMSEIRKCDFVEFDISYSSTSGCILEHNKYRSVKFSTACFFQVIGSNTFLDADNISLVNFINGEAIEELFNRNEIVRILEQHLDNEIRNSLSISRAVNGFLALLQIEESDKIPTIQIGKSIAQAILKLESPGAQILDELCNTLKTLDYYKFYSKDIVSAISKTISSIQGELKLLHPYLRETFDVELSKYKLNCEQQVVLCFFFEKASMFDENSVSNAITFLNGVREFGNLKRSENERLSQGSLIVELLAKLEDMPTWIAVLTVLGLKTRTSFDINIFVDQVAKMITHITSKHDKDDKKKKELIDLAKKLDVHIIIKYSTAMNKDTIDSLSKKTFKEIPKKQKS